MTQTDRRKYDRYNIVIDTELSTQSKASSSPFFVYTENVSRNGIMIWGKPDFYPFKNGSYLAVRLKIPDTDTVEFTGQVIHRSDGRFGIQISQIDQINNTLYNKFISELESNSLKSVVNYG